VVLGARAVLSACGAKEADPDATSSDTDETSAAETDESDRADRQLAVCVGV
jgi:hypothetical protein